MNKHEKKIDSIDALELVGEAYKSILSPERLTSVLTLWDKNLIANGNSSNKYFQILENQLTNAIPLLETSLRSVINEDELAARVAESDRPMLLIASTKLVVASNQLGRELFNLSEGDRLDVELMSKKNAKIFSKTLAHIQNQRDQNTFQIFHLSTRASNNLVKDHLVAMRCVNISGEERSYALLSSMDLVLSKSGYQAFQNSFSLTNAEMKIVSSLVSGQRQIDIARSQNVREDTVKKHIKNIKEKTETANSTALICLAASFAQVSTEQNNISAGDRSYIHSITNSSNQTYFMPTQHKIAIVDGYKVEFSEFGEENDKVIIIMHGSLSGLFLPDDFINKIVDAGYRVIIPYRPGFGISEKLASRYSPDKIAIHLLNFIDGQNIQNFSLASTTIGFAFAAKLAGMVPKRVDRIIGMSANLPIDPKLLYVNMSPYVRSVLYTLQKSRTLAKFLVLSGYKHFLQMGPLEFGSQLMKDSKSDLRALNHSNSVGILTIGLRATWAQGVDSFLNDSYLVLSKWSDFVEQLSLPIYLIHGDEDGVTSAENVQNYAEQFDNMHVQILENAGQLALYDKPKQIAELILDFIKKN